MKELIDSTYGLVYCECKTEEEIVELTRGTKLHHTSYYRDYVSRKIAGKVVSYDGRFGKGYQVFRPNRNSTTYCFCDYYINDPT